VYNDNNDKIQEKEVMMYSAILRSHFFIQNLYGIQGLSIQIQGSKNTIKFLK